MRIYFLLLQISEWEFHGNFNTTWAVRLRDKYGCPYDKEQTLNLLKKLNLPPNPGTDTSGFVD